MKKLALLTVLSLGFGLGFENLSLAQEKYVRKPLPQPGFFVPQKDVEYKETLPPFYIPEVQPQVEPEAQEAPKSIEFQPQQQKQAQPNPEPEFNPNLDINLDNSTPVTKEGETPKYKQEYEAYLKDLSVIAQTGKAPYNSDLEADLSALSDDSRLEVNEDGKISPHSSNEELINPMALAQVLPPQEPSTVNTEAQIIDSVEIINLPEELQKTKDSSTDNVTEEYDNPFAQGEELNSDKTNIPAQVVAPSPEVAAHFRGGSNPFAPQKVYLPAEIADNQSEETVAENTPKEELQTETYTPPQIVVQDQDDGPKVSRSAGRRTRKSSSSSSSSVGSGASFGLGPNMVR